MALPFLVENKEKYTIYVSKKSCEQKHVDFLMIEEVEKKHYALINDFSRFMYDHSLHRGRKHFVAILHMLSLQKKH